MLSEVVLPMVTGKPKDQEAVNRCVKEVEETIGKMNKIFLKGQKFFCGEEMSIADLFAISEIVQPLSCPSGKALLNNQPEMAEWMKRVEDILNPEYDELNKQLKMVCQHA